MFKSKQGERISEEFINSNNIVGKGTTFRGNVQAYGTIRIEGRIIGDVKSKSKVAVGQSAHIEGNILAQTAEIEGKVDGAIDAETLILKPKCDVVGNITTNKLIVEEGAIFKGSSTMGEASQKIEIDYEKKTLGKPNDKSLGGAFLGSSKPIMKAQ